MNVYIFEDQNALDLEPITLTRPSFEVRCGAFTCIERISLLFPDTDIHFVVRPEMKELTKEIFPRNSVNSMTAEEGLWLLGNVLWNHDSINEIVNNHDRNYYYDSTFIGGYLTKNEGQDWLDMGGPTKRNIPSKKEMKNIGCRPIQFLWEALQNTGTQLDSDLQYFKDYSKPATDSILINESQIFAHPSAVISPGSVIDASNGPIVIDKKIVIKPLVLLEGPLFLGESSTIESMTKLTGANSIGPMCRLGGEIHNVIFQGWSNKVHDGHLGSSYLGQWVNLGAGTINSNLKNNYNDVTVKINGSLRNTYSKHIGCFLGDHVKTAIGTRLNTGTVVGPGSNIAMKGFPPKAIQPFSWCVGEKILKHNWDSFVKTVRVVKSRREMETSDAEISLFESIYQKNE
ncbi:MAG: putative sugar nucleotidyl transferase [Fidelibacterota bacterium]